MDKSSRSNPMLVGENARQSDVNQSWEQDNQAWWDWYVTLAENESHSTNDLVDVAPLPAIDLPSDADIADELNTLYQLTPDKCEAFRRDGFIKLPNVFSLGAMVRLRQELIAILCENFDTTLDGGAKDRFLSLEMVWLENPLIRSFVLSSAHSENFCRSLGRLAHSPLPRQRSVKGARVWTNSVALRRSSLSPGHQRRRDGVDPGPADPA